MSLFANIKIQSHRIHLFDPPKLLADHAPINYVDRIPAD